MWRHLWLNRWVKLAILHWTNTAITFSLRWYVGPNLEQYSGYFYTLPWEGSCWCYPSDEEAGNNTGSLPLHGVWHCLEWKLSARSSVSYSELYWAILSCTEATKSSGWQEWLLLSPYYSIRLQHSLAYVNHRKHWFAVSVITTKIRVNKMARGTEGNTAQCAGRGSVPVIVRRGRRSVHSTIVFATSLHSWRLCTVRLRTIPAYI